VNIKVEFN